MAWVDDGLPPPRFDRPYEGPVVEWVRPAAVVDQQCRVGQLHIGATDTVVACSFKLGDKCFVMLPKVGPGGTSRYRQNMLRRTIQPHRERQTCLQP